MTNSARLIAAAVFTFGVPAVALAQPATPPHQHGQPNAATQPAQTHQQQQGSAASQPGQQQGDHQAGCQCPCCQMMMRMMQQHGQTGGMQGMNMMQGHGGQQPPATQGETDEHQRHQDQRPNQ